jgi:predicted phosphoadenosine phosphosulfate sulfurtransferase
MPTYRKKASINVVDAAYQRIKNIFSNGLPVYLSTSGGKDSIVLCQLVYDLIQRREIDPKQLTVNFIDEEGMYDCVIDIVKDWRKKFLLAGVKFDWYCLEVMHFNCLNKLSTEETWVCWDKREEPRWIRRPPAFAIREHPLLNPRKENYQSFLDKLCADGITIIGVRAAESIQRLKMLSVAGKNSKSRMGTGGRRGYPIYDWKDKDIWLFIKERKMDFPEVYLYMYQIGLKKSQLRVCNFFAIDTIGALLGLAEYYPDLMEKVERREPNAYLVALYWDSEMFGRSTKKRKDKEKGQATIDYRKKLIDLLKDIPGNFHTKKSRQVADRYKKVFLKAHMFMTEKHYKLMYEDLLAGDTKLRGLRATNIKIYMDKRGELG